MTRGHSRRGGLGEEDRGVEFLILLEGRLGMFQLPLSYPGVFFSRIPFLLDQIHACQHSAMVAYNLFNLIFFFSFY